MIVTIKSSSSPEEVEIALKKLQKNNASKSKKFDSFKYCGTIKLKEDPIAIQKSIA